MPSRLKVPIFLAVAVCALAYLVAAGVSRNDLYMSTLDQWSPERARRESVRVMGFVADGSVVEDSRRLLTHFTLRNEAGDRTLPVVFEGVTPDLFRGGAAVIVSGRLGHGDVLEATDLMTKCPSKYEGEDVPHGTPPALEPAAVPVTASTGS